MGAVGGVATTPSRGYYWYRYNESGYHGHSYYGPGYDLSTVIPVIDLATRHCRLKLHLGETV